MQKDAETEAYLAQQARRMLSFAMYRKLKSVVDSWEREERGKTPVVAGAAYGLAVWILLVLVGALLLPRFTVLFALVGSLVWLAFVVMLIRKHLGAQRGKP